LSRPSDREVFLELLSAHEGQLLGFLCAVVPSLHDAEDLLQQTVLTMWQKFDEFDQGSSFVAWGRQVARNKALNHLRARRLRHLDEDIIDLLSVSQPEEPSELRDARRRALGLCLEKLSRADRALVESAYREGAVIKDLAALMSRPAAGVYNSLARIRGALYRCIAAAVAREGLA
jgi:RNA polymerase sigma-70 factor (ECF subfamily)